MKIMYVTTDLNMGGAEIQVMRICKYMAGNTHNEISFVSMMKPESVQMIKELKALGVMTYSLNMARGKASLKAYRKFVFLVKHIRPEVIHTHMVHANFLFRAARPFIGKIKIINTIHGEEEYLGKRIQLYKASDRFADYTVACGKVLYEQALKYRISSPSKLKYICNGLDLSKYSFNQYEREQIRSGLKLADDSFLWITVGRLSKVKNQTYLINEFYKVQRQYPNARLMIVGNGPLERELRNLVKKLDIEEAVIFAGKRDDVEKILSAADAFVLSSIHEGLPLSMQEAAAEGLPIVSTDVGGCNEVVLESENGFLCESNKTNALADVMKKMLSFSKDQLRQMGKMSRKIALDKFDMSNVIKKWMTLYYD